MKKYLVAILAAMFMVGSAVAGQTTTQNGSVIVKKAKKPAKKKAKKEKKKKAQKAKQQAEEKAPEAHDDMDAPLDHE